MGNAPSPLAILETCLYVDDLDSAESFYCDVLGLKLVSRQEGRHAFFRVGGGMLLLFLPASSSQPSAGIPPHGALGPGHIAFHVPQETLPAWETHLRERGVVIEQIAEWPRSIRSLYFRDPAGNSLELVSAELWNH